MPGFKSAKSRKTFGHAKHMDLWIVTILAAN